MKKLLKIDDHTAADEVEEAFEQLVRETKRHARFDRIRAVPMDAVRTGAKMYVPANRTVAFDELVRAGDWPHVTLTPLRVYQRTLIVAWKPSAEFTVGEIAVDFERFDDSDRW